MTSAAVTADTDTFHGRNRVSSRAIKGVVSAITAEAMGVTARQVGVELADDKGLLEVTTSAAISVISLTATGRKAMQSDVSGSIIDRATAAQTTIRDRVRELTGSSIGRVNLRLNDAHIEGEERVQ
ncbi:hypothetical protein [Glaciihabitans sp. UYNi722]|uniref:hypothetical protein n=1 Tax=Glaciihabitans sp. UYNi722 TaxID=3156344 RepID=UPI003396C6D4